MSRPPSIVTPHDPGFGPLKSFIVENTGLAYYLNRDESLAGKLDPRLKELKLTDCRQYLSLIQARPAEMDVLISRLTVGETYFFRNRPHFQALEQTIIPDILSRKAGTRSIGIWSAGCSTGPEPYSLNILLKYHMRERLRGWTTRILGTDINAEFLRQANEATYGQWSFRTIPDDVLRNCFQKCGKFWVLDPEYRTGTEFLKHNLVRDAFPPVPGPIDIDLIVCRNVLIYFSVDIIRALVTKFHSCLRPGGWLMVGHAEPSIELFSDFITIRTPEAVLYQKPPSEPPKISAPVAVPRVEMSSPTFKQPRKEKGDDEMLRVRRLTDEGRWEEASVLCETYIEKDPLKADFHFLMALIFHNLRNDGRRDESLKKALYLDRGFIQAHYYRGVFECERGRFSEAGRAFRAVLRLLESEEERVAEDSRLRVLAPEQLKRMSNYYLERMGESGG